MAKKIGLRDIRALGENQTIWDAAVPGFGARRQRSDAVSYFLYYRTREGRQRWFTIGRHGPFTPDQARDEALRVLGEVSKGRDPAADKGASRAAMTVVELCDLYLSDAEAGRLLTRRQTAKRPSTISTDRGRIEAHIKPLLGRMAVASITRQDIDAFMHQVAAGKTARKGSTKARKSTRIRGGKGAATRTMGLLGAIFAYAVRHGMRDDNPVRGIVRFADGHRERRLGDAEYKALAEGLSGAEVAGVWPPAIAVTRFLALTGWRSSEALLLRWDEVDLARRTATLSQTKTGKSVRPLSRAACDLLKGLSRAGAFVFPATRGERGLTGFPQVWARKIAPACKLPAGVTPHTLRHSFASLAGDLGYSEPTIAALVGHKGRTITSRYVHSADVVLLAAADAVADATLDRMGERKAGVVVELRRAVQ